ncbi:MAG: hypothetical protein BVN33_14735 [Proteobacteria bacterium ST_bin13]|nr:MAG: hypothetical protein BVN33_14735 [Proteobacteria bacterium ST_bin13]
MREPTDREAALSDLAYKNGFLQCLREVSAWVSLPSDAQDYFNRRQEQVAACTSEALQVLKCQR